MSVIHFPPPETPPRGFALFELGFRPFFLAAGLSGALLMLLWVLFLAFGVNPIRYYTPTAWHGHEMLFGFSTAVVVGFLLTAVRNWTQVETIKHGWLATLAAIWLAGRLAPISPLPNALIAVIDIAFLPLAAAFIAWPLLQKRQFNNLIFVPLMLAMAAVNISFHLSLLGMSSMPYPVALDLMRWLLVILLSIMGGRVIPFFIERGHPDSGPGRSYPLVEKLLIPLLLIAIASRYANAPDLLTAALFMLAAISQWIRLAGWYQATVWKVPMLWILVVGYAWLPLGLSLMAFAQLGFFAESTAQHALTAGALGCITVGMMARVTRGHTGRSIDANRITIAIFGFIILAGAVRVFGAHTQPTGWLLSGSLWTFALALFTASHWDYWWQPRIDGRPG